MITENETIAGATSAKATEQEARDARAARLVSGRSIGDIVAETQTDISNIVRKEIQLAKTEMKVDVAKAGKGAGMFGAAAVLGIFGLNMLLFTLAFILDIWLWKWVAFGIVTLLLLGGAGILALMGKKAVSSVNPKPERTIRNAQETVETIKTRGQTV